MDEFTKTLENAARLAAEKEIFRFTRFLDPAQAHEASLIAKGYGVSFRGWGGYDQSERVIGCFFPREFQVDIDQYPLACLGAKVHAKFAQITHRDLLGAFMALGLTRDCIGDMIILSDRVYLFASEHTADFIASSLTSAGRVSLCFERLDTLPEIAPPSGTTFSSVVSSLRLDAMLAAAYHLSRSEAASCIRGKLVKVNHLPEERTDILIKEDSLLSLRGRGRVRFVCINGSTRKQRIGVTFFRYE